MDEPRVRLTICLPLNDNTLKHVENFISMLTQKFHGATYSRYDTCTFHGKWLQNPAEALMLIFVEVLNPGEQLFREQIKAISDAIFAMGELDTWVTRHDIIRDRQLPPPTVGNPANSDPA